MKAIRLLASLTALCLVNIALIHAGEIGPGLEMKLTRTPDTTFVPVWIKLPAIEDKASLRSAAPASAGVASVERHRAIIERLKSSHGTSQAQLLAQLHRMERQGQARDVEGYWITNMVTAEVRANHVRSLAARFDIETIFDPPVIVSVGADLPRSSAPVTTSVATLPASLTYIKANQAWVAEYTGAGRIVCTFDSGVDGDHPALASSWKGNDGNWRAAWFDPVGQDSFPHTIVGSGRITHGTEVTSVVAGRSSAGDTLGVAPGAKWISAAVTDLPTQNSHAILEGFQWAADPDGDPNTIADRPDVINCSWGFNPQDHGIVCQDIFFDAIDKIEALGIVCVFAAGNKGPGTYSIANPANRALDSIDCFAVGASQILTADSAIVASFSSRGPSDCDNFSIKPNVIAPGTNITVAKPGGSYSTSAGTSFSAPHVSGLVALLRQKNPNASVDEIKLAILNSANRSNFTGLPDNNAGWGEADCMAALNALSPVNAQPNVRVSAFDYPPVNPGDTLEGTVVLKNLGASATGVTGTLTSNDSRITILQGNVTFGAIAEGDTVRAAETIRLIIDSTVEKSAVIALPFDLTVSAQPVSRTLSVLVEPMRERGLATHNTGRIEFTVSNFGMYGMGDVSIVPAMGAGFKFDGGNNHLWEGGLIMGTSFLQIASAVHSFIFASEYDFAPASDMQVLTPGPLAPQQTYSAFTDANDPNPTGVRIVQETFSFDPPDDDFILMRLILENPTQVSVNSLHLGLFLNWDIVNYTQNAGGYDQVNEFLWMAHNTGSLSLPLLSNFRGAKLVDGNLSSALTERGWIVEPPSLAVPSWNGFLDTEKWTALNAGTGTADTFSTSFYDLFQTVAAGPISLAPGQRDTVGFAIMAGSTFADLALAAQSAQARYNVLNNPTDVGDDDEINLPTSFALAQNYPNPFNPTTTISFDLPRKADYTLTIYNVLGQEVKRFTGNSPAGSVAIEWDATDFASGVYLYKLTAGDFTASRKMVLLK